MLKYAIRRVLILIPVILSLMFILYAMLYFTPGDPARIALGEEATPEAITAFREEHGLNDPFLVQFARYAFNVFTKFDLGYSYNMRSSVSEELAIRIPTTMKLAFAAVLFSTVLGLPLGILSAIKQYSFLDSVVTVFILLGVSMPTFWMGLLLILAFSVKLGWLPSMGFETLSEVVLPVVTLSGASMALFAKMTRSSMLEVIKSDFIRTARAKGQKESVVIWRHALPNALIPVMTIISMQFGALLGGSIVTEAIFSIPGVGRLMLDAINLRDYPIIQGGVLFISVSYCFINLIVDLLYAVIDPRITFK